MTREFCSMIELSDKYRVFGVSGDCIDLPSRGLAVKLKEMLERAYQAGKEDTRRTILGIKL